MIFFDIVESEEAHDNKSKCNYEEADFTKILIDFIARKMSLQGTLKYVQGQIGVISPYKAQVKQLYSRIERLCADQGCSIQQTIEVNTVDAFQGSEKDIIIFNCVRSNYENQLEKSLGFLLDERRLNVAITRPKYFLMVVGNAKTL
jgi:superfamily I DNA and/or RNA helicase